MVAPRRGWRCHCRGPTLVRPRRTRWSHATSFQSTSSKLRTAGGAGEGDHVADVAHAGDELDGAFEAQAKAGVGDGAEAAQIKIPPVVFGFQMLLGHSLGQYIEPLLALAAADDLADLGDEDVHRPHG